MAVRRLHPDQPASFEFSAENLAWANHTIAKYPDGKQASAVIPLLWRAQEQHQNWLPEPAIRYVADMLGMAYIRVYEIATFYTMFQLAPVGRKAHVQVCGTTPCMLRGAEELVDVCKRRIAAAPHQLSEDGDFSWEEVECLGVCANAPMVQVGKDTYEDLTPELLEAVIDGFAAGAPPAPGSQTGRQASAPQGGPTTLTDAALYIGDGGGSVASPTVDASGAAGAALNESGAGSKSVAAASVETGDEGEIVSFSDADRPKGLESARGGQADDLKIINGVGPKIESTLNELGIFHFDQIAAWSPETAAWVDNFLSFKGRIDRDKWIEQAAKLAREKGTSQSS